MYTSYLASINTPLCMYETGDWMACSSIHCCLLQKRTSIMLTCHQPGSQDEGASAHIANAYIHMHIYFFYIHNMGYKSHSAASLQATKPKCVAMSLMLSKWEQMRMAGKAVPRCIRQEETENRERERRKYLIISTLYGELRPCALRQSNYQDSAC